MAITRVYWDYDSQTVDYRGYDVHVIRNGVATGQISRALILVSNHPTLGGTKSLFQYIQDRSIKPDFVIDISEFMDKKRFSMPANTLMTIKNRTFGSKLYCNSLNYVNPAESYQNKQ